MNVTAQEDADPLADLPPSAKYVFQILQVHDDPMTRQQIERTADLPKRTTNYALVRLRRVGMVETIHPDNGRATAKPRYRIQNHE